MTVNATSTRELDIDKLVMLAIQTAGVLPPGAARTGAQWNNLATQARDFLELNIDHMQTLGSFARTVEFYDIDVDANDGQYDLPSTTMSVVGDARFAVDGADATTMVRQVTREEYNNISDKTSTGTPTLYYPQMHATITLFLWPVPAEAGTLTIQRNRLLADNNDGSRTVDLERHWIKHVMFELAHSVALAASLPAARCGYLRAMSERALESSKRAAVQPGNGRLQCSHRTGWNR